MSKTSIPSGTRNFRKIRFGRNTNLNSSQIETDQNDIFDTYFQDVAKRSAKAPGHKIINKWIISMICVSLVSCISAFHLSKHAWPSM